MKRLVPLFFIMILCAATLSCGNNNASSMAEEVQTSPAAPDVIIHEVIEGPIYKTYTAIGTVEAYDIARIMPRVQGRIKTINAEEGDPVVRDDLLMLIDTFDYEKAVKNTTAIANQAKASFERIARDLSRMQVLYNQNSISEQAYQDTITARDLARYQYDQAINALDIAIRNLRECSVTAPISGMVTQKLVNVGELTGPAQLAFVIMNMDMVKVEVDLPEEIYGSLKEGETGMITLDAIPDKSYKGKITKIYPTIDPLSRTCKVELSLKNPGLDLRSGMTARVGVVEKTRDNVLSVPKSALIQAEQGYFIYRIKTDTVEKTLVELGIEGDSVFEITDGVSAGDQVVTIGLAGLRHGMKVQAVQGTLHKKE
ncbi:MAG: efflux RND transporter periplasmic adaptor subunit [Deltaproteobacteria bacterium]|nr:efflux RND transporter periplasmic adaptor subunit [Deltaproteobacteria bacterium]